MVNLAKEIGKLARECLSSIPHGPHTWAEWVEVDKLDVAKEWAREGEGGSRRNAAWIGWNI